MWKIRCKVISIQWTSCHQKSKPIKETLLTCIDKLSSLVNGGLSKWSNFGLCSKSCGGGVRMRHRECNNPVPRYGGAECDPDDLFETQSCGNMKCPAKTLKRK